MITISLSIGSRPLRRVLGFATAEGATAQIIVALLGGTFLTAFVLKLGASSWHVGLVASLGPLTQLAQVFAAYFVERSDSRKRLALRTLVLHRFLWSVAGLIALLLPSGWNLATFLLLYVTSYLIAAPGVNAWVSLMADTVPSEIRGRYFGNRWMVTTICGMAALVLAGWLLDHLSGLWGFASLYLLGVATSALNWFCLTELPEIKQAYTDTPYWAHLRSPFQSPRFRLALLWLPFWTLVQQALTPFYTVLMIKQMQLSYSVIAILAAVLSVASAASFPLWGRLIDRLGPFRLAAPAALLSGLVPVLWLGARGMGLWYLVPLHLLLGMAAAALQSLTMEMNMRLAPPNQRAVFLAIMGGANGLAGFCGPLLAGILAERGQFTLLFVLAGATGLFLAGIWRFRFQAPMTAS